MQVDNDRFEALYRKYYGRLWRHFRLMRFDDDVAQDLVQDTFKRLYDRMSDLREETEWAYIELCGRSVAFNRLRQQLASKRSGYVEPIELSLNISANPFTGEESRTSEATLIDEEESRIQREKLIAAMAELSDAQRDCLGLWMQGLSYEEIRKALGISLDAVKSRLRDSKKIIRERMTPTGR